MPFLPSPPKTTEPERKSASCKDSKSVLDDYTLLPASLSAYLPDRSLANADFYFIGRKEIIRIGVEYLRVEGSFYLGIGYLFLWYGFYRAICKPHLSIILTILSLGTRVALAYFLASIPSIGVHGIWWSIPIGWALADIYGQVYYWKRNNHYLLLPSFHNKKTQTLPLFHLKRSSPTTLFIQIPIYLLIL